MNDPASLGRRNQGRDGRLRLGLLAAVFTIAATGSLVLVVLDLWIHRPVAGDMFIALLNALTASVLWRVSKRTHN